MELFVLFGFILILTHDYFPGVFSFILFLLGGSFLLCFLGSNPLLIIPFIGIIILLLLFPEEFRPKSPEEVKAILKRKAREKRHQKQLRKKQLQEDKTWETQSPKVEGYHPNNGWEYIETPTSSETSSQTPFNPQP